MPARARWLFGVVLLALLLPHPTYARDALDRPNLVLIFLDDSGYADVAHTGNPTVRTPNLTRLAQEGMNFTQFYAASPACSASRYALLTGRNPRRSGLGTWVLSPGAARYIHPNEVTLAEGLKARGYATGMFGKWHLGDSTNTNSLPLAHGFDRFVGTTVSHDYTSGCELLNGPSTATPQHVVPGYQVLADSSTVQSDTQLTQRYADGATAFIQTNRHQPFFLYLAFNMPHLALNPNPAYAGKSPAGRLGDVMEEIDDALGRVRATLEREGIATNTLVIFTSDNGPWVRFYHETNNAQYGDARLDVGYSGPFRDGKGSTWEGGVREVGVWCWPGVIAPGSVERRPASTMDVLPTVFALAGQPQPTGRTIDGRDLRAYLNATQWPAAVPEFVFIYTGNSANNVYGVRQGPWKLHTAIYSQTGNNYGYSGVSFSNPLLFHLEHDVGERWNQRATQPAMVTQLQALITAFNAQLATEGTFWGAP